MSGISGNVKLKPEPYNLDDPEEVLRLYRECKGYLHTCRRDHHGTDFIGRQHAVDALEQMIERTKLLRRIGTASRRQKHAPSPSPSNETCLSA